MPPAPPAPAPGGKKILGMKRSVAIPVLAGGAALLLTLGYLWWKSRKPAAASATTSASTSSSALAQDYAGQLSVIQTELEELLGRSSATGTSTGSGGGTTATSKTGTTTTSKTGTGTSKPSVPKTPAGVKATKVTATNATMTWDKSAGATSYQIRVTYQDKLVRSGTASGTTRVVNGLTPDHTYGIHVKACNSAGCSSETDTTVKTPRS